ncbi:hypothetical protein BLS_002869 [Venturia inaequalis]|uniref:Uncharacterized protein n=1 Tax=Venturia inaequalis TaxID=5025 RepID=A0A8H3UT79_VENIN|nr:hypothetical protein BLS_002869 [Venturia inaequalis]
MRKRLSNHTNTLRRLRPYANRLTNVFASIKGKQLDNGNDEEEESEGEKDTTSKTQARTEIERHKGNGPAVNSTYTSASHGTSKGVSVNEDKARKYTSKDAIQASVVAKFKAAIIEGNEGFKPSLMKFKQAIDELPHTASQNPLASFATAFSTRAVNRYKDCWFIDSGSSDHITNNASIFILQSNPVPGRKLVCLAIDYPYDQAAYNANITQPHLDLSRYDIDGQEPMFIARMKAMKSVINEPINNTADKHERFSKSREPMAICSDIDVSWKNKASYINKGNWSGKYEEKANEEDVGVRRTGRTGHEI